MSVTAATFGIGFLLIMPRNTQFSVDFISSWGCHEQMSRLCNWITRPPLKNRLIWTVSTLKPGLRTLQASKTTSAKWWNQCYICKNQNKKKQNSWCPFANGGASKKVSSQTALKMDHIRSAGECSKVQWALLTEKTAARARLICTIQRGWLIAETGWRSPHV